MKTGPRAGIPARGREAITSDIMLNWSYATAAHGIGLNIGYSDGSGGEIRFDTPWPGSGNTFLEALISWQTDPNSPIHPDRHHEVYRFFDK